VKVLSFVDCDRLKPLKLVVNPGNGAAGPAFDTIAARLPFEVTRIHHEPDGRFPNGIPNPLLPENRAATAEAVRAKGADLGIAWDGDYDRCFLFDETGRFIEGYYIVGLLAAQLLEHNPGAAVIHDPRLTWNTREMVVQAGGLPVLSKTGHAFIKERMRREDALYGGEMSAHHYFRDFAYCDSGMIPWLLVAERMSVTGRPLSALVSERIARYPCSGEINFRVADTRATLERIRDHYRPDVSQQDTTDGLSMEFDAWRFNLRASNTEPLLRLNVETRGDRALMERRTTELGNLIQS
jgi:phosphomannomutase/phosphomannomutase/phosphoglucomutase